jgi:hypothetical protein
MTDGEVLAEVDAAFARAPRPEHFAERPLDLERKDHDDLLRSRTRETLMISDVEMPGFNPINCMTAEAFRYYFPALARLGLRHEGEAFLTDLVPFHLCDALCDKKGRHTHPRLSVLNKPQRAAILGYVRHVANTRRHIMEHHGADEEELDRAVQFWEIECKTRDGDA